MFPYKVQLHFQKVFNLLGPIEDSLQRTTLTVKTTILLDSASYTKKFIKNTFQRFILIVQITIKFYLTFDNTNCENLPFIFVFITRNLVQLKCWFNCT